MAQIHYKELGLVNTREMFQKAMAGHYAVPAYNFNNLEQLEAIIIGCIQSKSPVILQCSGSARKYMHEAMVPHLVKGAVEMMEAMGASIPIALHLDHGDTFELAKSCINSGFSSVMIDGSHHPFEENIRLTRQVADYAHERDVTVEGELGVLAGVEDEVSAAASHYTRPSEVEEFVQTDGGGLPGHLHRHLPRGLQVQGEARRGAAAPEVRHPGRDRKPPAGISHRAARRFHGHARVRGPDQPVWRQDGGSGGHLRRAVAKSRPLGGLQNQHRQRRPPGHDRGAPEDFR